jgi:flavin reductase (DIM6/NTAB) family NADH-FMN oxidoreductase RutF
MKKRVALNLAHRLLSGRPTCLLTTRYKGEFNVMAIAWTTPVSLEPPLIAMAIHPSSHTHGLLRRSEECVLNVPGRPLIEQTLACGTLSGRTGDKLPATGLTVEQGRTLDVPWIHECLAHIECGVVDITSFGDHTVFVVQVLDAWVEEEAFGDVWLAPQETEELMPFTHLGGKAFGLFGRTVVAP